MLKEAVEAQDGKTIDHIATEDINVGDIVPFGAFCGVAATSAITGESLAVHIVGIYEVKAKEADEITIGKKLYFDTNNREATITEGDNYLGFATSAKAASIAGHIEVKIG